MRKIFILFLVTFLLNVQAQEYVEKIIGIAWGDYTEGVVLLHEYYDGTRLGKNFAIGTISAMRGNTAAFDRLDVANIYTSSSYEGGNGFVKSYISGASGYHWQLKLVRYNGKKYIALQVPYCAAYHDLGFRFNGWITSTAESLISVPNSNLSENNPYQTTLNEDNTIKNSLSIKGRLGIRADATPTTPDEVLRVEGGFTKEENVMNVTNMSDQDFIVRLSAVGANDKRTIIGPTVSNRFSLGVGVSSGNEYLTIINGGNVGIGTISPQNKLDVNGTIHAKEVKVDLTNWPDFVFAPTYKLRSLSEVEQHIKDNGHLPDIAPAAEMQQNGVSVSEMQTKLLQKVEELTLYVIEQQKEINELKKELKKTEK